MTMIMMKMVVVVMALVVVVGFRLRICVQLAQALPHQLLQAV